MAATSADRDNTVVKLVKYIIAGLDRTIFLGLKFTLPRKFVNPFGYLGMLTTMIFIVLGVSGAILMIYYEPTFEGAWNSVESINDRIPYGMAIRNIHYHASNAMVFLAVVHLYYQYFSGRYKIKNEIIWVTGVILGLMTILEAFTGYDLIYNDRAVLAISIGASLTNASPIIGTDLLRFLLGAGHGDFVIRLYAFHVFILPLALVVFMLFHFPRYMVLDLPIIASVIGAIFITAGLFPIELGVRFEPDKPPGITVPEWYLTSLYAFIRTGYDRFVTGGVLPLLLLLMFIAVPFIDRGRRFSWKDRPFFTAMGIASITQISVTTVWGFYVDPNPLNSLVERLFIKPEIFWSLMIALAFVSFGLTYAVLNYIKARDVARKRVRRVGGQITMSTKWVTVIIGTVVIFQVLLNWLAYTAYTNQLRNLALLEIGLILLSFSVVMHLYRSTVPASPAERAVAATA